MNISELIEQFKVEIMPLMIANKEAQKEFIMNYETVKRATRKEIEASGVGRLEAARKTFYAMVDKGYTKTLVDRYTGRSEQALEAILQKDLEKSLLKIDVAVNKKIKTPELVSNVENLLLNKTNGFVEGLWSVEFSDGTNKELEIKTILAGGYNVQCLHIRTLYKLKKS